MLEVLCPTEVTAILMGDDEHADGLKLGRLIDGGVVLQARTAHLNFIHYSVGIQCII